MSQPVDEICVDPKRRCFGAARQDRFRSLSNPCVGSFLADLQRTCTNHGIAWRVTLTARGETMSKQPIAVELEAINRDGRRRWCVTVA